MKKLYLLRGLQGSGKSYLAKSIAVRLRAKLLSADDFHETRDSYAWTPGLAYHAHRICEFLANQAMAAGERAVVIDNTNLRPKNARTYAKMAKKYGYELEVVEPNTPWCRNPEELALRNQHGLTKEAIEENLAYLLVMPTDKFLACIYENL